MEIICPKCSASNREGAKFCNMCGERLNAASAPRFCDECGAKLTAGSKFCDECGASAAGETAPTADAWDDALASLTAAEEEAKLAPFEYERRPDGSVVITGLLDRYAMHIDVPGCVTAIGAEAFAESNIITASLPNGLTAIDKRAFYKCASLTEINIPTTVLMIGDEAFAECIKLDIAIPEAVRIVGRYPLRNTLPEIREREARERAEAERREKERAEAERRENERLAKERAERERIERANAEREAKRKKAFDDFNAAGDPDNREDPRKYGFSGERGYGYLIHDCADGIEHKDKTKTTKAYVALAKGFYFGSFGYVDKEKAKSLLICVLRYDDEYDTRYYPGIKRLLSAMENGEL